MNNLLKGIIIGIIVGLIIGGVSSYLIFNNPTRDFFQPRGNFQVDETTQNEIISFFENNKDIDIINSYCEQNRMNCIFYCRNINENHEICNQIQNMSRYRT